MNKEKIIKYGLYLIALALLIYAVIDYSLWNRQEQSSLQNNSQYTNTAQNEPVQSGEVKQVNPPEPIRKQPQLSGDHFLDNQVTFYTVSSSGKKIKIEIVPCKEGDRRFCFGGGSILDDKDMNGADYWSLITNGEYDGVGINYHTKDFGEKYYSVYIFDDTSNTNVAVVAVADYVIRGADMLPAEVGQCYMTKVKLVGNRLEDINTRIAIPDSGSKIEYTNGTYQTNYEQIPGIDNSKVGDSVVLCLVATPKTCAPGLDMTMDLSATNVRTGENWQSLNYQCTGV
ncbi:MAG: hypothetical protein V4509_04510 [Patescibacteria group bacterium]